MRRPSQFRRFLKTAASEKGYAGGVDELV